MARPSVHALFRSAAMTFGPRGVGVVLTGPLNDGASVLYAVNEQGGASAVQHPFDAETDAMPLAALEATQVRHVARACEPPALLSALIEDPAPQSRPVPEALKLEAAIAAGRRLGSEKPRLIADPAPFTCPHCHGVLSEVRGGRPLRFRCQIGHAFTAGALPSARGAWGMRYAWRCG